MHVYYQLVTNYIIANLRLPYYRQSDIISEKNNSAKEYRKKIVLALVGKTPGVVRNQIMKNQ